MNETSAVKTVSLTIDGQTVSVPEGDTILTAARRNGVDIPTLCFLEKLKPIGSCRICSVEVEGSASPIMSCVTPVVDGMKVVTSSEQLSRYRQEMMRFILTNHPLDCPVCERSGECLLQNRTFELNVTEHPFRTIDYKKTAVDDWNELRYNRNLCIFCERCVKVCWEIQGFGALAIGGNGYQARIVPTTGETLDCDFCGQCLAVCPVGAISSAIIFSARSWEIEKVETICPFCAVGCSIEMNVKNGALVRNTSNDNIGVNNGNLCARGRFGHESVQSEDRFRTPLVRKGVKLAETGWDEAIENVAGKISEAIKNYGPDSVGVIVSETVTNEDAYLIQKVFRAGLKSNRIETLSNMLNPKLNSGIFDEMGSSAPIASYDRIGEAGSFVFFGCDAEKENPVIANMVRVAMRDSGTPLFVANTRNPLFKPHARQHVRYEYGTETLLAAALIGALKESGLSDGGVGDPSAFIKTSGSVSVSEAAKSAGVSEEAVRRMAEGIKTAGSPLIFLGKEIHDHPKGAEIARALSNLANLAGGRLLLYREYCNSQGANDMGLGPSHFPGYLRTDSDQAAGYYSAKWGVETPAFPGPSPDMLTDLVAGKIKVLMVVGCDPITHYNDGQFVREAIQSAGFVVVTGSYDNETGVLADVALPTTVAAERDGSYTNNEGRVQLLRKGVEPVGQSKPEWEIFRDLGVRMGMDMSYETCEQIAEEIAELVPGYHGLTHNCIARGGALITYPGKSSDAEGYEFDTATIPSDSSGFPFVAIIGNSLFHLGVASRHSKALNHMAPGACLEISPDDAVTVGVSDGDNAVVESVQGSINVKVVVTGRSSKGIVFITKNFENAPATHLIYRKNPVTRVKVSRTGG